jgi:hypothetical protein
VKLPEGEAYMPRFLYNPNHAVSKAILLGEYHLTRATHEDLKYALEYFSKALEISPGHIRAQIGVAETGEGSSTRSCNCLAASLQCFLLQNCSINGHLEASL